MKKDMNEKVRGDENALRRSDYIEKWGVILRKKKVQPVFNGYGTSKIK